MRVRAPWNGGGGGSALWGRGMRVCWGVGRGAGSRGLGEQDVALVVPDSWQEGRDYLRSPKLVFRKGAPTPTPAHAHARAHTCALARKHTHNTAAATVLV